MASGESIFRSSSNDSNTLMATTQSKAMHSLCKHLLKSKIFRGHYVERRYVELIKDYRDVIALQNEETELEKQLLDVAQQLYAFYQHETPKLWIGITQQNLDMERKPKYTLNTCIWTELHELPYGEYWFNIKSVRFREQEIILKVKVIRPVTASNTALNIRKPMPVLLKAGVPAVATGSMSTNDHSRNTIVSEPQIGLEDFLEVIRQWGVSIKQATYEFLANDISRENLVGFLRFLGLLVISVASGAIVGIKFLGVFTLRFMFELSRLINVLTPIAMTIVDVFNKIVGGFYLLLAMIWRDAFNGRKSAAPQVDLSRSIAYNRPIYKSIQYNVMHQNESPVKQPLRPL